VKRLPIIVKVSMLLICFSLMLYGNNTSSIINDVLIIQYVDDAPIVDGSMDEEWDACRIGMRVYTTNNDPVLPAGGAADLSAWYAAAWNEDGFYFYGEVIDDTVLVAPVADEHVSDSWEIFFDGDNSKGASYDDNDVQFRWIYDADAETKYGIVDEELMWAETDNGYALELSLPASSLADSFGVVLEAGKIIGWETQVNDAEVEGTRQNQVKWWSDDDRAWNSPSYFGTAMLATDDATEVLIIPRVEDAPIVDGSLDAEWTGVVPKVAIPVATSNNDPSFADGGDDDLSAFYHVAYNDDGLYFYGEALDDSVLIAPVADEHVSDSWEIFFDGDNSKGASYDDNDVQFRWIYDADYETKYGIVDEEVVWAETETGYALELLIPASSLADSFSVNIADETVIGWEVQINDAEVEGTRQNQIKWWSHDDRAWNSPVYFGTAILTTETGVEEEAAAANIALSVAPVITSNAVVSISVPAGVAAQLSLYNIAGQKVLDLPVNGNTASLNASGLANGVYLCALKAGNSVVTKKITLIK
jgi:endo-1,4-beta-xylanase